MSVRDTRTYWLHILCSAGPHGQCIRPSRVWTCPVGQCRRVAPIPTQNVYGKSCWEERVDAVTRAVDAVSAAAQNAEKETNRIGRNPSATNGGPNRKLESQVVEGIGRP